MNMLYDVALSFVKGVGPILARTLISYCGDAESVFKSKSHDLLKIPGCGQSLKTNLQDKEALLRAEQELRFAEKHQIHILPFTHEAYPQRLKQCYDAPYLLYYKGQPVLNYSRVLSVVGTRSISPYGHELCQSFIAGLQSAGILVVSGLAYGVDIEIHRNCLQHKIPTLGVLAHGLDALYPAIHRNIAHEMLEQGGILTEFPIHTRPERPNFPQRNRIIAGMAHATVVVEANLTGGALITAQIANSYNLDVFAFPGRVNDEFSKGCNQLIQSNEAALIRSAEDLLLALDWQRERIDAGPAQRSLYLELSALEKQVLALLTQRNHTADELMMALQVKHSALAEALLSLEMHTLIAVLPGQSYKLL